MNSLTPEEIQALLGALPSLPLGEQTTLLAELEELERLNHLQACRDDFLTFCKHVYPDFKEGPHHRHMKPLLHGVKDGSELRVTISMAPRFGKSHSISYLFVAWYLGHNPTHHIIMVTHTASLSADFGRNIRNLIDSEVYRELFPDTVVSRDKSAADNWTTTLAGKYLAIGIGANVAGHGAHLLIADDLVSEKAIMEGNTENTFASAWQYMQIGPLQRLMPGGRIIMIGTRWGRKDPIGRALAWADNNADSLPWNEVRFPAIMPSGKSLWPEQWPLDELLAKKAGMAPQFWAAQYMQEPTSEEGALIKREWWKIWPREDPPECEYIISSWDTAHETKNSADYTACTLWGVWFNEDAQQNQLIMLDAFKGRWEFPQLKKLALEHYKDRKPDTMLVEKKAAGAPLLQELRMMGIPVSEFTPSRGNDKRARVNAVSDLFFSGCVWIPDMRWAHEVVQEVSDFPSGLHDDYVDTVTQAVLRYRSGGFIRLPTDEVDAPIAKRRHVEYY